MIDAGWVALPIEVNEWDLATLYTHEKDILNEWIMHTPHLLRNLTVWRTDGFDGPRIVVLAERPSITTLPAINSSCE